MTELERRTRVLELARVMHSKIGRPLEPVFWDILDFVQSEVLLVALEHTQPQRDLGRWMDMARNIANLLEPPKAPEKKKTTRKRGRPGQPSPDPGNR